MDFKGEKRRAKMHVIGKRSEDINWEGTREKMHLQGRKSKDELQRT
jgi:hypothetical protein